MNKTKTYLKLFLFVFICSCASNKKVEKKADTDLMKKVYSLALQGDVKSAMEFFSSIPEEKLQENERALKEKFIKRFVKKEIGLISVQDKFVRGLIVTYRKYWQQVLMKELSQEKGAEYLFNSLKNLALETSKKKFGKFSDREAKKLGRYVEGELKKRGYFGLFGTTKPHLELMVWGKQEEKDYKISLHDTTQNVKVDLLNDFSSLGWSAYATFDRSYTGGWATKEKLFCVASSYDLESEDYKVSYLSHEGRHFADYKKFPKLEQPELEYRAKLTQLTLADETLLRIIKGFRDASGQSRKSPHAFANFHVYKNLTDRIFQNREVDWKSVDKKIIHQAAKTLIDENSKALKRKGASNVKRVL